MKAIETATPPPTSPPVEEFVESHYHHNEGPPAVVSSEPRPGPAAPAAPAPPPPPDTPIAELLHPPPYTVFVDSGHGALDSGAGNGDLLEKDVNVDVATRLAPLLGASGYNVYLSRWGDYTLTPFPVNTYENRRDEIQARVDVANQLHADILVSIHFNGGPKSARGLEVYYNPDRSFGHYNWTLADLARQGLVNHIRSAGYDVADRGVKNDAGVCCNPANPHSWILGTNEGFRPSMMPGIIGEALFVSNDFEAQQLWRPEMRQAIAEGYKAGIDAYFGWLQPQVPPPPPPPPTPEPTPEPTPAPTASPTDTPAPTPSPPTSTPSSTPSPSTSSTGTPTPSARRLPGPSPGST
jgi:N-acetylmuramoyl-L-alanine amidase